MQFQNMTYWVMSFSLLAALWGVLAAQRAVSGVSTSVLPVEGVALVKEAVFLLRTVSTHEVCLCLCCGYPSHAFGLCCLCACNSSLSPSRFLSVLLQLSLGWCYGPCGLHRFCALWKVFCCGRGFWPGSRFSGALLWWKVRLWAHRCPSAGR